MVKRVDMVLKPNKFLLIMALMMPVVAFSSEGGEKAFNPAELINHHISDAHSWEIFHGFTVHLPVILYSEEKGLDVFMSSNFYDEQHNIIPYNGYEMHHERISSEDGTHVLDLSVTKNVLFLFFDAALLILIFGSVARGYKKNAGKPPKTMQ
ncbi:MAG: F0F1 ATP synthase subunit A, partial [Ekhidna sp.]|nr:F0F1 ATP synthase subunit A [Ekhidna sp.]